MAPKEDVVQKVFLGLELCVCLAAVMHSAQARLNSFNQSAFQNEACTSDIQGEMCSSAKPPQSQDTPQMWTKVLADPNLAIAALSLIVFVVRALMLRLKYLTLSAGVCYDMLLSFLWAISVMRQTREIVYDSRGREDDPWPRAREVDAQWGAGNRGICHSAAIGVGISTLAVSLYCGRLLFEILNITTYALGLKHKAGWEAVPEGDGYCDTDELSRAEAAHDVEKVYAEALSPVLAFFPEHMN